MEIPLLKDIIIIFILSIAVILVCHRLKIPSIVGFLITGILAGPQGLGIVGVVHEVKLLAEIGIVILLFTIGMEFSIKKLLSIEKIVLVGGSLQVFLTILAVSLFAGLVGRPLNEALFLGFLISLSSTAIVLKLLQEKADVESPRGKTALGILIYQDIAVVPMMLVTPFIAGAGYFTVQSLIVLALKIMGIIILVVAGAKWIVPNILYRVARTGNREIFLLTIIAICLGVAWLTSGAGLSLALGAFLAGLIISESEYSHQAVGNIIPFRDVFMSFFFVSIGMLLDVGFLLHKPVLIILVTLGLLVLKTATGTLATIILGIPLRIALLTGFTLCQIGEFSFILSETGLGAGLIPEDIYQLFLACTVISMAATPFILSFAPRITGAVLRMPLPERLVSGFYPLSDKVEPVKKEHLVIIGFGVNGRNVARAAEMAVIPYVIIEMNPETVRQEQAQGLPIYYGDATQEAVIRMANIVEARIAVVAINDPAATRRIAEVVRRLGPKVHLIVRTRFLSEMKPLFDLGADEVIPEEFETSVEIFSRVLAHYLIPRDDIERFVTDIRTDGYEMFRGLSRDSTALSPLKLDLSEVEISTFRVTEDSSLAEKTLGRIQLRKKYGISVLAIRRRSEIIYNPSADDWIEPGDILFVLGTPKAISEGAVKLL
ncbi:MAG: cation:proton antiporter [Deltaproteobacteria bacterium]|nr:cation:proton antiporter [Deltaproteobacteria bacterium]